VSRAPLVLLLLAGAALGCKSRQPAPTQAGGGARESVEGRPFELHVPKGFDRARRWPLVVLLHGYGSSGKEHAEWWGLPALADARGFFLAMPDGTVDSRGSRFWNATDACCNFGGADVDDVAYVNALVEDVAARYPIDRARVFALGHSNGGFFAHRLACESDRFAAVASLAGAAWKDAGRCTPRADVAVLQAHGTRDDVVKVGGGRVFDLPVAPYPSLDETMALWNAKLGCSGSARNVATLDLDARIPGAETRVDRWLGCRAGLELWTIEGAPHAPSFGRTWGEEVWRFFAAHPKAR
jgi:polyhydroxybutyrate depolymerase